MMKTIIDKNTGLVIFCAELFDLQENQIIIDKLPTEPCENELQNIYWDFNKKQFYVK